MSVEQRYQVLCIEDSSLVNILLFMYRKWIEKDDTTFAIESADQTYFFFNLAR